MKKYLLLPAKMVRYCHRNGFVSTLKEIKKRLLQSEPLPVIVELDPLTLKNRTYDIIFVIGCHDGESKRYRVYNIAHGLEELGHRVLILNHIDAILEFSYKAKILVLFRMPADASHHFDTIFEKIRQEGGKIVFDVDDIVFDASLCESIGGYQLLDADEKKVYLNGIHLYRELINKVDYATLSTQYLADYLAKIMQKEAEVIPNSINLLQLELTESILSHPIKREDGKVHIGYLSGTRTHNNDFKVCSGAIEYILEKYPNTVFVLVGYLDLPSSWQRFGDRIKQYDFMYYANTLSFSREHIDINIAPLEVGTPFCESKSQLKFFEAGLVEIPTIASPTAPFKEAIDSGVDGFLASDEQEWKDIFEKLIHSPTLRLHIGKAARARAIKQFSYQNIAKIAERVFGLYKPVRDELHELNINKLKIAWVINGLLIGGGGHRNILRVAYHLSLLGHEIHLYFIGTAATPEELKKLIHAHFYPLNCFIECDPKKIKPADVIFATHWATVATAMKAKEDVREVMYFVQDYEPFFFPMGSEHILAENTYKLGLYHITSGPWCKSILQNAYKAAADHFQFPIDRTIYYPRERTYKKKNIIFFAKPELPRRCFELGLLALEEFHKLCPDIEIIMFGSSDISESMCPFPVTLKKMVPTLAEIAELYSNADAGIVFSPTNLSLVPYEMMACGLPIIDLNRENNKINYGDREDIALLVDSLPKKIALSLSKLLCNPSELKDRKEKGLSFVKEFPSEENTVKHILGLITQRLLRQTRCAKKKLTQLRINFVLPPSSRITGGPLAILEYVNRLAERGHHVSITTYPDAYWEGDHPFAWFDLKAKVYYKKNRHDKKQTSHLTELDPSFNFFSNHLPIWSGMMEAIPDCDINIATFWETVFPVYCSKKGKPVYFMQHYEEIFYSLENRDLFDRLCARMSYNFPMYKVANSSWLQKLILTHYEQHVPFSNNGIAFADFTPRPKKSERDGIIRIVTYARPESWKGFADAVAAMKIIKDKWGNQVEWNVFGYKHSELPENNPYANYTYHPKLSFKQLAELFAISDIALCPSWYESFPLPPLEAMASGTAVVTTAYGTEDYAFHEKNALVIGSRDIDAMVQAIDRLITQPDLRAELAKEGRKTAEKFDWPHAIEAREKILLDIHFNRSQYDVLKPAKFCEKDAFNLEFEKTPQDMNKDLQGLFVEGEHHFLVNQGVARRITKKELVPCLERKGLDKLALSQLEICRIPRSQPINDEIDLPI